VTILGELVEQAAAAPTAMMCAEVQWWRCHRMLIADRLKQDGHQVLHILGPGPASEHPWSPAAQLDANGLSYRAAPGGGMNRPAPEVVVRRRCSRSDR
jgi:hypothetical protein